MCTKPFILALVSFTLISSLSFSGIEFRPLSISEALLVAKAENKLLFIDFYSTQCPPCKYMEAKVYSDQKLGDYINSNFVAIHSNAGNIEGKKEKYKYAISSYPTILILHPESGEILRLEGKREITELQSELDALAVNQVRHDVGVDEMKNVSNNSDKNQKEVFIKENELIL